MYRNIQFTITPEQAEQLAKKYDKDPNELDDWEFGELLDRLIDDYTGDVD